MTNAPNRMTAIDGGVEDGIEWATVRAPLWGAVNGYVRVPEGHPWHGLDYDDIDVEVHGGLTYSDGEWIGFDTLHGWDIWPGTPIRPQGGIEWSDAKVVVEARSLASKVAAAAEVTA